MVIVKERGECKGFSGVLFYTSKAHEVSFDWVCTGDEKINLTETLEKNKKYWDISFEPDDTNYS